MNVVPIPKTPRIKDKKCIDKIRSIGCCEYCGSRFNLEVHHIKTKASGGGDTEDNLICLCWACHSMAHDGNIDKGKLKEIVGRRNYDQNYQSRVQRPARLAQKSGQENKAWLLEVADMKLPETISEITSGLNPAQLDELLAALADEVMRISKTVASYEVAAKLSAGEYKKAQAKAVLLLKDSGTPSIVKLMIEGHEDVIAALNILEGNEALYVMGKAELDGRTAQYQAVKKLIDLKVEELRAFKAGHR